MLKNIGLLTQGLFGGTDRILDDFHNWLVENNYTVRFLNGSQQHDLNGIELIVLPTSELHWLWNNRNNINKKCRIMVWCMGHDALQSYFYNSSIQNIFYKRVFSSLYICFANKLISQNIFAYTDLIGANLDLNNLRMPLIEKSTNIYPIPIDIPTKKVLQKCKKVSRKHSLFWVGRVDRDFKVWSLLELLKELDLWVERTQEQIKFYIIGDGDGIDLIDTYKYLFNINKLGILKYIEMENMLREEATLVFAMGTSAIEGAKLSIPTVIVNPLRCNEKKVTYRWIYDSIGYSLGEFKSCFVYPEQKKKSLTKIFEQFVDTSSGTASKSYNYSKRFNRNDIYSSIMNASNERPSFSSLKNSMFIPFLSSQLKKLIRFLIGKKK